MSIRVISAIVAVLFLQTLGALWLRHSLVETRAELASTSALVVTQKADIEALRASQARIQANIAAVTKRNQEADRELQTVLDALGEAARRPTPRAVVDSLCKRLRCAHSDD